MSFFAKFLGDGAKTPEALATVEQVGAALDLIARERQIAADNRRDLLQRRIEALANDATDKAIAAIDAQIDALALVEDRLEILQPRLLRRLDELQSASRRETLATLEREYQNVVRDLDSAMQGVLEPFARLQAITHQMDSCGFSSEARGFVVPPPTVGAGVLCDPVTLENWRRARENNADMRARAANPVPAPTPAPSKVIPIRRAIDHGNPTRDPAPMSNRRAPRRLTGPIDKGMVRIEATMNNADFGGMQSVIGDQHDVTREEADYILRGVAFRFVASEETLDEAAQ